MIEKLKRPVKIGGTTFREKINELVEFCNDIGNARSFLERHEEQITKLNDAVNELQSAKDVMFNRIDILNNAICDIRNRITALDDPTYHEAEPEPADPYAEQRRWIGKLCWVWDDDSDERAFTKLNEIIEDDDDRPFKCLARWKHCEPVKPDDDIIYKGE